MKKKQGNQQRTTKRVIAMIHALKSKGQGAFNMGWDAACETIIERLEANRHLQVGVDLADKAIQEAKEFAGGG